MNPFFSVIIPLYNKEKYVRKTLESVLDQGFSNFEIIVINDGSTDNSGLVVKEFKDDRIRYYEKENKGVSSARNTGISLAEGKYIAFLDADDYWYPYFLEEIYKYIGLFPEQKVFSTAIEFEYKNKVSEAKYSIKKTDDYEIVDYFEASCKRTVICSSSGVFEKNVFNEIGAFDTMIKRGEDTDLWVRIGLYCPILFIWKIAVRYTYDANSLSRIGRNIDESASFTKYIKFESTNDSLKKFLDLNRFSLAIKSKLINDKINFAYYAESINHNNLSLKKRILLNMPAKMLKMLVAIKNTLMRLGLTDSVFVR